MWIKNLYHCHIETRIYNYIYKSKLAIAYCLYRKRPLQDKIVIDNFLGKGYFGEERYITDELLSRPNHSKIDVVWLTSDIPHAKCDGIRFIKYGSIKSLMELYTAKIWISNVRNTIKPRRRAGQIYLQIWHGSHPVKLIEKQIVGRLSTDYIKSAIRDGKDVTHFLVDCASQEKIYKEYFWLNDNVKFLRYGQLRNDYLLNNKRNSLLKECIRKKFGISKQAYVILYAPTFRDDYNLHGYIENMNYIVKKLEYIKGDVVVLVRLHPNDKTNINYYTYSDKVKDASSYENGQDLALACDALITDYSTIAFDGAILGKPVYLLEKDIDSYRTLRGLSKQYDLWPFIRAKNEEDLIDKFSNYNEKMYLDDIKKYFEKDELYDTGNAAKQVVDWILKKMS